MKKELSQKLKDLCPNLYSEMWGDIKKTCLSFGIEAPDSWYEVIRQASIDLEDLILCLPKEEQSQYKAYQVKTKFGELRFYMSKSTKEMNEIISEAEQLIKNIK